MLSSFWKSLSGEDEERINRYAEQLKQLITYFPIGGKINYYPEFLEHITFESMILGYEINDHQIYARDHVRGLDGDIPEFFLQESGELLTAADLASFTLIVPDTSEVEKTLDYDSKAVIGKSGQFARGNSITLISTVASEGLPNVDTTVLRRTQVEQGYYQNYKVVILDPSLNSLTKKNRRHNNRMDLSQACLMFTPIDSQSAQCGTLVDCSELCVGIEVQKAQLDDGIFTVGMPVRLSIPMPTLDRIFELTGEIFAIRAESTVVVKLHGIKKDDKVVDLQLVDRLDLRASLVQCNHG